MNTLLKTSTVLLDDNHLRIDVLMENTSPDLFGIAFHISLNDSDWQLVKSEKGEALAADPKIFFLTNERKSPEHEIIFGASLNNADRGLFTDGKLASFYLWAQNAKNLEPTITHKVIKTVAQEKSTTRTLTPSTQSKTSLKEPKNLLPSLELDPKYIRTGIPQDQSLLSIYGLLGCIFVILLIIFWVWIRSHHKK